MCFLDTIKIETKLDYIPKQVKERSHNPFEFNNFYWVPGYNKKMEVIKYTSSIDNLHLILIGDSFSLNNSWGVFWNGNNAKDYGSSQIEQTYHYLDYITDGIISTSKPSNIAIGANIDMELDFAVNPFIRLIKQTPLPMLKGNKIYGYKFVGSNETLKIYSKTFEQRTHYKMPVPENLVRIELEMKVGYINRNSDISFRSTRDILNYDVKDKLAKRLINKLNRIEMHTPLPAKLSLSEKKIIACFRDQEIMNAIREEHPESYKKDRLKYKKLNALNQFELKESIVSKTTEKLYELINS